MPDKTLDLGHNLDMYSWGFLATWLLITSRMRLVMSARRVFALDSFPTKVDQR